MKQVFLAAVCLGLVACEKLFPGEPDASSTLSGPIEGLTPEQAALHQRGDAEFARIFGMEQGLGPIFVQASCQNCHASDGKGHPSNNLTRFGRYVNGTWDPMLSSGGPQLQHRAIEGYACETVPVGAVCGVLMAPNVSGSGLLEAVDDATLLALADSADANGDGISGRVQFVVAPPYFRPRPGQVQVNGRYVGRFGRKASAIDLRIQTVNAFKQDMGITSPFDVQDPVNVLLASQPGDGVADPEIPASVVEDVAFYLRTLKPPPRRNANDERVRSGEQIFTRVGCTNCHAPSLSTGRSDVEALSNKTFHPYTDLLMHDMGPELDDGYTENDAGTAEWRTSPLWGFGLQPGSQGGRIFLLHDGRATTVDDAVQFHGGEGSASRAAYNYLTPAEKEDLLKFLQSL